MKNTRSGKNTKKSNNLNTIVITIMTFLAIIAIVVCLCLMCGRSDNDKKEPTSPTVNISDYISDEEYLVINAKDCTIYNGDVIQLTCSSNPEEYASGVNWVSSDTSVLTVTFDGTVTAMSEGVAAVTATHGVLSNSIIIQVINEAETPDADFPEYEPVIPSVSQSGDEGTTSKVEPSTPKPTEPTSNKPTEPSSEKPTEPSSENVTKPSVDEPSSDQATEPSSTKPSSSEPESVDIRETIINSLPEYGFSTYTEDSYIFKEDGNYLGQVIVGHGFTQIYVMTRTTNFDAQLKDLLSVIIPTGYTRAFNNMANAINDMTFYSDGYKLRVVASPNGGHTQLIIYY